MRSLPCATVAVIALEVRALTEPTGHDGEGPPDSLVGPAAAPAGSAAAPAGSGGPTATGLWEPPDESSHRRRWLALAVGVLVFLVAFGTYVGRQQLSPTERIFQDVGNELLADPLFKERYGSIKSPQAAFEAGQTLGARGLRRLDDEQLAVYWTTSQDMLGSLDTRTCGAIFGGTLTAKDTDALARALGTLPADEVRRYAAVIVAAIKADLYDDPAARPAPTPARPPPPTRPSSRAPEPIASG